MSFLKKSGLTLAIIILVVALIFAGIFLTLSFSLNKSNIQSNAVHFFDYLSTSGGDSPEIQNITAGLILRCGAGISNISLPMDFLSIESIKLPCSEVFKGNEQVLSFVSKSLINSIYDEKYDCSGLLNCIKVSQEKNNFPSYLVSAQFQAYCYKEFALAFFFVLISLVTIFFLVEKKHNFGFLSGTVVLIVSVVFLLLKKFAVISAQKSGVGSIVNIFLFSSYKVFNIIFAIGLLLLIIGLVLKLYEKNEEEKDEEKKTENKK
ncbi:hypothetical protein J4474_00645 [Candidatus Pacearchaeota archaeon]|nr:hypothetical protein [Candidatus Pacearchaeota archaeon]